MNTPVAAGPIVVGFVSTPEGHAALRHAGHEALLRKLPLLVVDLSKDNHDATPAAIGADLADLRAELAAAGSPSTSLPRTRSSSPANTSSRSRRRPTPRSSSSGSATARASASSCSAVRRSGSCSKPTVPCSRSRAPPHTSSATGARRAERHGRDVSQGRTCSSLRADRAEGRDRACSDGPARRRHRRTGDAARCDAHPALLCAGAVPAAARGWRGQRDPAPRPDPHLARGPSRPLRRGRRRTCCPGRGSRTEWGTMTNSESGVNGQNGVSGGRERSST